MDLLQHLDQIDTIGNDAWMRSLDERKKREIDYANQWRGEQFKLRDDSEESHKYYRAEKYYEVARRSARYITEWIQAESPGRVFLDYCCGNGTYAGRAAASGAALALGLDISDVSLQNARKVFEGKPFVDRLRFFQADAENTKLPDESVDRIVCSGVLHHLDLSYAFPELRRILKPGGKIIGYEALDYNPLIKLYRKLTPDARTEWESTHILSLRDLDFASRFFDVSDVRYWHVVGYASGKAPALRPALVAMDKVLEKIPYVNRLAWMFTFCLTKP